MAVERGTVETVASEAYQKIKSMAALPAPSGTALEIIQLANDERSEIGDVAAVVESDPAIASRLLRYVNSPLAGLSREIASVSQAVAFLGVDTLKSIALGLWLLSHDGKGLSEDFDYEAFRSDSVARAVTMRHTAYRLKSFPPDEAFTCGLLCQLGRLAFAAAYPQTYAHALSLAAVGGPGRLVEIEREIFGIDHNELAAEMLADWHLPAVFCDGVRFQDSPEAGNFGAGSEAGQLARMLNVAGYVSSLLTQSCVKRVCLTGAIVGANRIGIKPDSFAQVFDSTGDEWQAIGTLLNVATRQAPPLTVIYSQAAPRS